MDLQIHPVYGPDFFCNVAVFILSEIVMYQFLNGNHVEKPF